MDVLDNSPASVLWSGNKPSAHPAPGTCGSRFIRYRVTDRLGPANGISYLGHLP